MFAPTLPTESAQPLHVARFFSDDDLLVADTASRLAPFLEAGCAVLVIATATRGRAITAALGGLGIDIAAAASDGRFALEDAQSLLAEFVEDGLEHGTVDPARFDATVGERVRALLGGTLPVCAYGEMVCLLWEAGNVSGAIDLERLWNELGAGSGFSLLCSYRVLPDASGIEHDVEAVCAEHSGVIEETKVAQWFPKELASPGRARRFVASALSAWGLAASTDVAVLVTSELATNALNHAESEFYVTVSLVPGAIRITVSDPSTAEPEHRRDQALTEISGRGLVIVDALAERWGTDATPTGKVVWAEIAR